MLVSPVGFLSPKAEADGTVIWRKMIVLLLCPFLVMWFLSTGSLSTTSDPCSWLSCELGIDCLVWKWIQLLKQAKHQIRALKPHVWPSPQHSFLSLSVFPLDSAWTWSVLLLIPWFLFYTHLLFWPLFAILNGILHLWLLTDHSLQIMKNNVMGFIVYSQGKVLVAYCSKKMLNLFWAFLLRIQPFRILNNHRSDLQMFTAFLCLFCREDQIILIFNSSQYSEIFCVVSSKFFNITHCIFYLWVCVSRSLMPVFLDSISSLIESSTRPDMDT